MTHRYLINEAPDRYRVPDVSALTREGRALDRVPGPVFSLASLLLELESLDRVWTRAMRRDEIDPLVSLNHAHHSYSRVDRAYSIYIRVSYEIDQH
jgi:hypothetical protein